MPKDFKMHILAIAGSGRRHGSTETLLDRAIAGARSCGAHVRKIVLNDLDFKPCQACGGCAKTGCCILKDDLTPVFDLIDNADGIILASPIYFASVSAQTKMMIDRFQSVWIRKNILKAPAKKKKRGLFISVAGEDRPDFFANAKKIVRSFFVTIDTSYGDELFYGGIDEKNAMRKDPKALVKAFASGKTLAKRNTR